MTGRISTVPRRAPGIRAAMLMASSRSLAFDQEVAAELFARLRERTVGHERLAVAHPDAGRRRGGVQRVRGQILPARLELVGELRGLFVAVPAHVSVRACSSM